MSIRFFDLVAALPAEAQTMLAPEVAAVKAEIEARRKQRRGKCQPAGRPRGRPRIHMDRDAYRAEWMRRKRANDREQNSGAPTT